MFPCTLRHKKLSWMSHILMSNLGTHSCNLVNQITNQIMGQIRISTEHKCGWITFWSAPVVIHCMVMEAVQAVRHFIILVKAVIMKWKYIQTAMLVWIYLQCKKPATSSTLSDIHEFSCVDLDRNMKEIDMAYKNKSG